MDLSLHKIASDVFDYELRTPSGERTGAVFSLKSKRHPDVKNKALKILRNGNPTDADMAALGVAAIASWSGLTIGDDVEYSKDTAKLLMADELPDYEGQFPWIAEQITKQYLDDANFTQTAKD